MDIETSDRPTDRQLSEAMITIEDAIGVARQSRLTPGELETLLAAIAPIPEIVRRNSSGFVPYKLAIAIEDAQQAMRDLYDRPRPASRSGFRDFFRRSPPRLVLIDGPEPERPTTAIGRIIYRLRYGRPVTARELRTLDWALRAQIVRGAPRSGIGVGEVIPNSYPGTGNGDHGAR